MPHPEPMAGESAAPATIRSVILASSLGTLFEWYDFYLYGTLAVFFGQLFFPPGNERAALLASLATFGAGFGVRPLGAVVFGRLGDLVGRKYTFVITMVTMGLSTAFIGFLPTYAQVGLLAPAILVSLRLLQGLALGGEYGGAATYVAEHVPDDRRGYYTSFIQTTATLGFFVSLGVIAACRYWYGPEGFRAFGWRIPFLLSFVLLGVSLYIRLRMSESPLFSRLKSEGRVSKNPLKESFGNPTNLRYVLFLGTPLFVVFGSLSDRIGRKRIMLGGCLLGALTYVPIYHAMKALANPTMAPSVTSLSPASAAGLVALLFIQMTYVAMVYGPIAAYLVELFPTSIRYTSMSLPYHLGNGWFGGFLPLIATAVTTSAWARATFGEGAIYAGLMYPIAVCLMTVVIGALFIHETKDHHIDTPIRVAP
jgi:MFS family permease